MVVVVPLRCKNGSPPEWAMIEMNGELVLPPGAATHNGDSSATIPENDRTALGVVELGSLRYSSEVSLERTSVVWDG